MPESAEIIQSVERGYLRAADIAKLLGVSRQRGDQLTHMPGFPKPKVIAGRRMWKRTQHRGVGGSALVVNKTVAGCEPAREVIPRSRSD